MVRTGFFKTKGGHPGAILLIGSTEETSEIIQFGPAGFSQTHPTLATQEQFGPNFIFQIVNLPAQRGLRQMQAGGSLTDIQFFGHRNEAA